MKILLHHSTLTVFKFSSCMLYNLGSWCLRNAKNSLCNYIALSLWNYNENWQTQIRNQWTLFT